MRTHLDAVKRSRIAIVHMWPWWQGRARRAMGHYRGPALVDAVELRSRRRWDLDAVERVGRGCRHAGGGHCRLACSERPMELMVVNATRAIGIK